MKVVVYVYTRPGLASVPFVSTSLSIFIRVSVQYKF